MGSIGPTTKDLRTDLRAYAPTWPPGPVGATTAVTAEHVSICGE